MKGRYGQFGQDYKAEVFVKRTELKNGIDLIELLEIFL